MAVDQHLYGQCAWCTTIEDGPGAGSPMFQVTEHGVEALLLTGYTHGICEICQALLRGEQQLRRELRNAPPVRDHVIYFAERGEK